MTKSHIYPGAAALNAYLTVKNCKQAIEFYQQAFGATNCRMITFTNGLVAHAEIEIEGCLLMLADENLDWGNKSPETLGGNPVLMSLYVKDVDLSVEKAVAAGAKLLMPVKDEFYGDRAGQILDPFGYRWMLATNKEVVSFEEMQKRLDAMMLVTEPNF